MNAKLRVITTLAGVAMVVGACTGGATPSPATSSGGGAASNPPASTGTGTESGAPASAAPLTGTLAIWEAYGASGTSEKDAFDKIVANVKAANPGLTVNVTDVPFNNL